jgi:hypothetical protein
LGEHKDSVLTLPIDAAHKAIVYDTDHFALLSSQPVYQHLQGWLRTPNVS